MPRLPAFLPWYSAPAAWAASSMTGIPRSRAAARIGSISAVWPYKWTGMIAAVLRVIADASFAGSMLYDERSMSTKTGFAPHRTTVDAVAKNVRGGITTACPGPMPWAGNATWRAAVPFATAIACFRPRSLAKAFSNASTFGPWASIPDARTSRTAASSSSPRIGRAIGIIEPRSRRRTMKVRRSLALPGTSLGLRHDVWVGAAVVGAAHAGVEGSAAFADPADELRRHAGDEGMRGDILGNDGAGGDHRVPADRDAADNSRVRSDRRAVLDFRRHDLPVRTHGARIDIVRETDVRAYEDPIPDGHAAVYCGEVLDFAVVSNHDRCVDVDIFPDVAALAHARSLPNLGPVPHRRPLANRRLGGHLGGPVYTRVRHRHRKSRRGSSTFARQRRTTRVRGPH